MRAFVSMSTSQDLLLFVELYLIVVYIVQLLLKHDLILYLFVFDLVVVFSFDVSLDHDLYVVNLIRLRLYQVLISYLDLIFLIYLIDLVRL